MIRSAELNVLYSEQRPNGASFDSVSSKARAENRLIGVSSAREAMEVWMQSEGFKSHILDPEVKSIGVGCFPRGKSNVGTAFRYGKGRASGKTGRYQQTHRYPRCRRKLYLLPGKDRSGAGAGKE